MTNKLCECCLAKNDLIDITSNESANLISLCFSIHISSPSSNYPKIFICNMCSEKLKDSNKFRCQILDSQIELNKLRGLVTPIIEPYSVVFKCESVIKEEVMSDAEDSINDDENEKANITTDKRKSKTETISNLRKKRKRTIIEKFTKRRKPDRKFYGMSPEEQKKYHDCLKYISDNNNSLDCGICNAKFNSHKLLVFHMAIHCPNFTCETCGKSFLLKSYLHRHMKTHEVKEKVSCAICNKNISSSNLHKHMKTHSGCKQLFTCSICQEKFESRSLHVKHMADVHNRDTYKHNCNFCSKIFYRVDSLNAHIYQHHTTVSTVATEEESYSMMKRIKSNAALKLKKKYAEFIPFELEKNERNCKVCGEDFVSYKSLMSHLAIHYPNFICDTCGKPFLMKQYLVNHMKSHEGENVTCTLCEKVLKSRYLSEHMKIHSGKTNCSICPECGERFELRHQRLKHMEKAHHIDIYKFPCNSCSMKFYLSGQLKSHIRRCHLKELNVTCNVCGKGFFSKSQLKFHMVKHTGEKVFMCDVCSKSFTKKWSLVVHMRSHSDKARKYKCLQCDKQFTQNGSLTVHMKNMHEKEYENSFRLNDM